MLSNDVNPKCNIHNRAHAPVIISCKFELAFMLTHINSAVCLSILHFMYQFCSLCINSATHAAHTAWHFMCGCLRC